MSNQQSAPYTGIWMDTECNLQHLVLILPIKVKKIIRQEGKERAKHAEIIFKKK